MYVILAVGGDIKVEDNIHVWYIQPPAGHICSEEDGPGLGLELVEAGQPLVLRHLTVQGDGVES